MLVLTASFLHSSYLMSPLLVFLQQLKQTKCTAELIIVIGFFTRKIKNSYYADYQDSKTQEQRDQCEIQPRGCAEAGEGILAVSHSVGLCNYGQKADGIPRWLITSSWRSWSEDLSVFLMTTDGPRGNFSA